MVVTAALLAAASHNIGIGPENTYAPRALRVPVGDTVTWAASDTHPLRFDAVLGESFTMPQQRTLTVAGVVAYHCTQHGAPGGVGMSGTVAVDAPPTIAIERQTATPRAGESVAFRANAGDPEGKPVRIDWDLDGDGAFEKADAGPTASATYAGGEHTVHARAVDDLGATAVASHAFTVAVPGGGGPGTSPDTKAPNVTLQAPRSMRAKRLRRRGVKLTLTTSEDGRFVVVLRNRRGRQLARKRAPADADRATVLRVRAPRAKPGRLRLRIVAIDGAGNRTAVKRRLTVR